MFAQSWSREYSVHINQNVQLTIPHTFFIILPISLICLSYKTFYSHFYIHVYGYICYLPLNMTYQALDVGI